MADANSITVTALDVISASMRELGILDSNEQPNAADGQWGLQKLQRLIDRYNARLPMIYNVNFTLFTLNPPSDPLIPTSIGPGADFDCNQRPISIPSIGLVLAGTPGVELPMTSRDDAWWANNRIKALTSTLPTDYYYSPSWNVQDGGPNDGAQWGSIYFWPVPTASHQVNLCSRQVLGEYTSVTDSFTLPPGYWDLIVYELAISLAPSFGVQPQSILISGFKEAQKAVQSNNISSPRLASDVPAGSTSRAGRPDWDFLTGLVR